ncbi:MAG: GDP-mannose 4,6-dehydratase [Chloroflexi bacterium]|nr:GDP-mannose 4,6-dehydratase [Chloroflexota bacterium]
MTKALITGGCGFIGSHLAEALLEQGDAVTVVDDLSTGRFENVAHLAGDTNFHYAITTITNELVMDRLISECDVVYHLAAAVGVELIVRDPVRVIDSNIKGCETVLRTAARYRKKVLLASTSEVYGKSDNIPFREDSDSVFGPTSKSRWSYACSKAMDEFLAFAYQKQLALPVVIMRFFNTVGPRQTGRYGMVVPRFVQQALRDEPLTVYGDGQQSRCFTAVADVVRAITSLANEPRAVGEIFNIGSSQEVTIEQLARLTVRLCSSRSPLQFIPYDQAYEAGFEDMRRRVPDTGKIRSLLGWQPTINLEGILTQVIAYYRDQLNLV